MLESACGFQFVIDPAAVGLQRLHFFALKNELVPQPGYAFRRPAMFVGL